MDADDATAFRARPSLLLPCDKRFEANLPDVSEILDHAHAVLRSITLVEPPQSNTGERSALKTESLLGSRQRFAVSNLTDGAMPGLVRVVTVAAEASLLLSEMADAETTVHPAGRDQR